jgi:hypothetical protein
MPQLLAPLCVALAAVAGSGPQVSTHSLTATASFAPRTSLTISTPTLRFVVTDPAMPAYATIDYSAAARTLANGEVALMMRVDGDVPPDGVLSISGGSDGVVVGEVAPRHDVAAARWAGSGMRTGRLTVALSARPGTYDIPVTFFLRLS